MRTFLHRNTEFCRANALCSAASLHCRLSSSPVDMSTTPAGSHLPATGGAECPAGPQRPAAAPQLLRAPEATPAAANPPSGSTRTPGGRSTRAPGGRRAHAAVPPSPALHACTKASQTLLGAACVRRARTIHLLCACSAAAVMVPALCYVALALRQLVWVRKAHSMPRQQHCCCWRGACSASYAMRETSVGLRSGRLVKLRAQTHISQEQCNLD